MTAGAEAADRPAITALELSRLLAHDCRTPLHAIAGFAELVLGGGAGPLWAEAMDYLRQIAEAGRALGDALLLAQELGELATCPLLTGEPPVDLTVLLQDLGFARIGETAARRLPWIRGERAAWLRIGEACRRYLAGGDGATLTAQVHTSRDGGLELVLKRADLSDGGYVGVLAVELARRAAACQGGSLRVLDRGTIAVSWPGSRVVGDDTTAAKVEVRSRSGAAAA